MRNSKSGKKGRKTKDYSPYHLTPAEVAARFRVDPKTVTRWAKKGQLSCIFTPGGHRRYSETEINEYLIAEKVDDLVSAG